MNVTVTQPSKELIKAALMEYPVSKVFFNFNQLEFVCHNFVKDIYTGQCSIIYLGTHSKTVFTFSMMFDCERIFENHPEKRFSELESDKANIKHTKEDIINGQLHFNLDD